MGRPQPGTTTVAATAMGRTPASFGAPTAATIGTPYTRATTATFSSRASTTPRRTG